MLHPLSSAFVFRGLQRNEVLEAVLCTLLASSRRLAAMDAEANLTDRLMLASAVVGMKVEEY